MLNKEQILKRLEGLLAYKGVANGNWLYEQIESLISSANSPEVFVEELNTDSGCPCGESTSTEQCEDCQDLPRGFFKMMRRQEVINFNFDLRKRINKRINAYHYNYAEVTQELYRDFYYKMEEE